MKDVRTVPILVVLFLFTASQLIGQNCETHHTDGDCRYDLKKGFEVYSQSHSVTLSQLDTIEINAVFYGQKDYILSFCTHKKMYPIHFILIDQQTKQVLYDNEEDNYLESLGLGFNVTKSLIIKVDVLARGLSEEEIKENPGCLGLLIQYKNYPNNKAKP
ncbi:MAG: hypothetical protein KAT15_18015 [Bacteroidales bacterium]|nr:hypothetical protein [Bacteroidales bacterium]